MARNSSSLIFCRGQKASQSASALARHNVNVKMRGKEFKNADQTSQYTMRRRKYGLRTGVVQACMVYGAWPRWKITCTAWTY